MKLLRRMVRMLWVVVAAGPLLADGPDDLFVRAYNLLQQGDTLHAGGQTQAAREKYEAARGFLVQIRTTYPSWNQKIVNYRMSYIADRIGRTAAVPPETVEPVVAPAPAPKQPTAETPPPEPQTPQTPTVPAPSTAPPTTSKPEPPPAVTVRPAPAEAEGRALALAEEVRQLQAERELLQAKLREALTAQPAAVDPRELAKAEQRIEALLRENEALKRSVAEKPEPPAKAADADALVEAQKALREAQAAAKRQAQDLEDLTRKNESLQQELKKATTEAEAVRQREAQSRGAAAPTKDSADGIEKLSEQLKQAQAEAEAQRNRVAVLEAEKTTLQKHFDELSAARVAEAKPPAPSPAPAVSPKAAKAAEKARVKELERDRDELQKRVAALTRELQDRRLASSTVPKDRAAEELAVLRARIQVYEARQVPYSPEELALFKQTPSTDNVSQAAAARKKAAREYPAGVATLVAEAQRAFQGRRLDEAEKKLQQALVIDDRNVGLLADLAATHLEQNRLDAAEATLARAMAADGNDAEVLSLLGLLRFRQEKYDEALDVLSRSARLNPDNPLTQNYLGVTLSQKGQRGPAETAFRKAIQIEPNYAEAHYNLAVVYAHQKPPFPELARWHYRKALAAGQPRNADIEKVIEGTEAQPR